jgi:hypothetical protein
MPLPASPVYGDPGNHHLAVDIDLGQPILRESVARRLEEIGTQLLNPVEILGGSNARQLRKAATSPF